MFKNKQNNQAPCRDVGNYNIGLQPQLLGYGATTIVKCKPQKLLELHTQEVDSSWNYGCFWQV